MNIAAIMIPKVLTVFLHETDTIRQGLERFTVHGYTAVPVLNEQEQYIGRCDGGRFPPSSPEDSHNGTENAGTVQGCRYCSPGLLSPIAHGRRTGTGGVCGIKPKLCSDCRQQKGAVRYFNKTRLD